MARKLNRNAQRSIRLIEEAFLGLLMEEPYEKITVTQIVNRADLNRGTFYAHYKDVDDLAGKISDKLADQVMNVIEPMLTMDFYKDPRPLLEGVGDFISERRPLFERLATASGAGSFFSSLIEKVRTRIRDEVAEKEPGRETQVMVACDYLSAGFLWACRSWAVGEFGDRGMREIVAELAKLVQATSTAWTGDQR